MHASRNSAELEARALDPIDSRRQPEHVIGLGDDPSTLGIRPSFTG